MKKLYIVANWKSNMSEAEANNWIKTISNNKLEFENKEIILCPSFTSLSSLKNFISSNKLSMKLGAQNISPFANGAYTGEINGAQIKEFAGYVIVGHSERRENFSENDEMLNKKVKMASENNLESIFCVQTKDTNIPSGIKIVAYEPTFAIGSGNPDTPENAEKTAATIKEKGVQIVLYGGSVNSENINKFTSMPNIDGVLVGGASLDAQEFYKIIQNA